MNFPKKGEKEFMSNSNELRVRFSELIRKQLKASGIKQCDLAANLGVSPSAVCQMLSGATMPQIRHLEAICELAAIPAETALELRSLRDQIRSGNTEIKSVLNRMIRTYREGKGYSLEKLAGLTGIPTEELRILEECASAFPTADQCSRLADRLDCQPRDLMLASGTPELLAEGRRPVQEDGNFTGDVALSEPRTGYRAENENAYLPEIPLRLLPTAYDFKSREAIRLHAEKFVISRELPDDCVIVHAPSRDFGMPARGEIRLVIRRNQPRKHDFAMLRDERRGRWMLGIMQPYRIVNGFDGTSLKASNQAAIWSVVRILMNTEPDQ